MRIYISGFPVLDRSSDGSTNFSGQALSNPGCKQGQIIAVPDYTVELVLIGEFISNTGNTVGEFIKRVDFFTRSGNEL